MKGKFKRVWNIAGTIIVVFVVAVALLLAGARIFGCRAYTVLSGSMEPKYHVGALIFVKSADPFSIAVGDAITFMADEDTVVTHRVTEIIPDEDDPTVLRFRTKGDANSSEDAALVHSSNLIGKPVFSIPVLGFVSSYIRRPPGTYIAIAFAIVIIVFAFLPDEKKSDGKEKSQ